MRHARRAVLSLIALGAAPAASAQEASLNLRFMGRAVLAGIHADPIPLGGTLTEVRVVQPVFMTDASFRWLRARATVNLEGATIPDGELATGDWGEGFVDRRHPHTYAHELMLWGNAGNERLGAAVGAGKGFVPFGTDDPMSRPFLRYPVNHHFAQILERAVVFANVRRGPIVLEGSVFNGDEPERPNQWPNMERFGDSWAVRLLLKPIPELELQGSFADVASPEHRPGAGPGQSKWSISGRWEGAIAAEQTYALVEWAQSTDQNNIFQFVSWLAEAAWFPGAARIAYRWEKTERPEETRTFDDPFRSPRPHLDDSIVGITRWTTHTLSVGRRFGRSVSVEPFVEGTAGKIEDVGDGLFDAESFYGRERFWTVAVGVRLEWRGPMHRMGRYGVISSTHPSGHATHSD